MTVPLHHSARLRIPPPALALALAAGCLLAAPAPAHAAARTATTAKSSAAAPLTAAAAAARAKATDAPVVADALTTATSTTTADPNGTLTLTQSAEPVRARRSDGTWAALDPTLHVSGSMVTANLTTDPVDLSDGGTRPLATLTVDARTLALTWPTALPVPTLSGNTATYSDVLPSVNLVVTVSPQGAVSDTVVVENAQAAANPALATLRLGMTTSPDLTVGTDAAGNLSATAPDGHALFTAPSPLMWDSSTTPPANSSDTKTPGALAAPAVTPTTPAQPVTASDPTGPGTDALTAPIALTVAPGSLTLVPSKTLLADPAATFPMYLDPNVTPIYPGTNTGWATVSEYYPGTNYWKNTPDLVAGTMQVGNSGTMWSRSLMNFTIPASLKTAHIYAADVGITQTYASSCTPEQVDLYAPSDTLSSANATWNHWVNDLGSSVASATEAYGYSSSCPSAPVGFANNNILNTVTNDLAANKTTQTFALVAHVENNPPYGWKKFQADTANIAITYADAPNLPTQVATSPGGACQTAAPADDTIGNNDITFSVMPTDVDPDASLSTEFVITNYQGGIVYDTADNGGNITTNANTAASITLLRGTLQGFNTNGGTTAYPYSWYTVTTDTTANGTLTSPTSGGPGTRTKPCNFEFNPNGPPAPGVSPPTPASPVLGQTAAFTITPASGVASVQYTYQLNDGPATTIAATGSSQALTIPMTHIGPNTLTVYAIDLGGNIGPATPVTFNVTGPATAYADADMNGDGIPDVLYPGSAADPGLWLATGTGPGTLNPPVNIGIDGTGINGSTGTSTDWSGAEILHGDFSGENVQDVMAYYPTGSYAGGAYLLDGNGDATATNPVDPLSGSVQSLTSPDFNNADTQNPIDLVAAGNASTTNTTPGSPPDLLAIAPTTASDDTTIIGYELDLYTGAAFTAYAYTATIAPDSPDSSATDWNNYTLATAQLAGQTVLFALDNANGKLYESTNPTNNPDAVIGTAGTWTLLSGTIPSLTSADVNTNGKIELWSASTTGTATAYTLTGTTLTTESTTALLPPTHDWPLNDGGTSTTAADIAGGANATLNTPGASWTNDSVNGTVLNVDGATGYLALPDNLIAPTSTLSIQFKTTTAHDSGVLLSTGNDVPTNANATATPLMYIGTDGHLYAQNWTGTVDPVVSPEPVSDGLWHTATLVSAATSQTLYLDDQVVGTHVGTIADPDQEVYAGAGVFNANTGVSAPGTTGTTRADYFTGDLADIQYTPAALTLAQLDATTQTTFTSGVVYPTGSHWSSATTGMTFSEGLLSITDNNTGATLFTRGTAGYPDAVMAYQTDGNLAIYPTPADAQTKTGALWAVNQDGKTYNTGDALLLQADGNLVLYPNQADAQSRTGALWASGTNNPPAGGYYQAITPTRLMDTRNGTGGTTGPIAANTSANLQVTGGTSGVPTTNVTGVILTITVTSPTGTGIIIAYPDTTAQPKTSNLNFAANQTIAASAVVPVGSDGTIKLTNSSTGTAQIIVDITGYFTTNPAPTTAGTYTPLPAATRVLDTRSNLGITGKLSPNTPYSLTIAGAHGIPATGITGVAINLTTVNTTGTDNLTAYADGTTMPGTTNIDFGSTGITANLAAVPVGTDGKIDFEITGTLAGTTDLIGDITGYFSTSPSGEKYHPVLFNRMLDTRNNLSPVAANASIAATEGTPLYPLPISLITNVTVTEPTAAGVIIAYPDGTTAPTTTSNLNFSAGQTIANLTIIPTTDNTIQLENAGTGTTELVADCLGYFAYN